jgi:hypothetical protein
MTILLLFLSCATESPDTATAYPIGPHGQCLAYTSMACHCWSHTAPDYWACDAVQVDAFCADEWAPTSGHAGECEVSLIRESCNPATTDPDAPFVSLVGAVVACADAGA